MEIKEKLEIITKWISKYDLETGEIWSNKGTLMNRRPDGYIPIQGPLINGKRTAVCAHQLIWFLATGEAIRGISHIDGNRSNNSIFNLKKTTRSQQQLNSGRSKNSKGYDWCKKCNKWRVLFSHKGKVIYGGLYFNEMDAINKVKELKELYKEIS